MLFVCQELRRQSSGHEDDIRFHHFRDKDGYEVDLVLEKGTRKIAGVEVKAAASVTGSDFRGTGLRGGQALRGRRSIVRRRNQRELRRLALRHAHSAALG